MFLLLLALIVGTVAGVKMYQEREIGERRNQSSAKLAEESTARLHLALDKAKQLDRAGEADEALTLLKTAIAANPMGDPATRKLLEELANTLLERARKEQDLLVLGHLNAALECLKKHDVVAAITQLDKSEFLKRSGLHKQAMALRADCISARTKVRLSVAVAEMSQEEFDVYAGGGPPPANSYFENPDLNSFFIDALNSSRAHAFEMLELGIRELDWQISQHRKGIAVSETFLLGFARIPSGLKPTLTRRKGMLTEYKWTCPDGQGLALKGAAAGSVQEAIIWVNIPDYEHRDHLKRTLLLSSLIQALSKVKLDDNTLMHISDEILGAQEFERVFDKAKWTSHWMNPGRRGTLVIYLTATW